MAAGPTALDVIIKKVMAPIIVITAVAPSLSGVVLKGASLSRTIHALQLGELRGHVRDGMLTTSFHLRVVGPISHTTCNGLLLSKTYPRAQWGVRTTKNALLLFSTKLGVPSRIFGVVVACLCREISMLPSPPEPRAEPLLP